MCVKMPPLTHRRGDEQKRKKYIPALLLWFLSFHHCWSHDCVPRSGPGASWVWTWGLLGLDLGPPGSKPGASWVWGLLGLGCSLRAEPSWFFLVTVAQMRPVVLGAGLWAGLLSYAEQLFDERRRGARDGAGLCLLTRRLPSPYSSAAPTKEPSRGRSLITTETPRRAGPPLTVSGEKHTHTHTLTSSSLAK